jgi:putative ATP-dependent endonuclease of the OLD family
MVEAPPPESAPAAVIRRLTIERFRGLKCLDWRPTAGVNVILGGGDVGKTTILEAIALLLSPTNATVLTDADYFGRRVEDGFCIEAVMSLPDAVGIDQQSKPAWPWEWDGSGATLPPADDDSEAVPVTDPVYRLRVRGTEDLDLSYEILQPDEATDHLHVNIRRRIGLIRLGGDDRNDRDLRLVHGSALDRLLADRPLRSRMGQRLSAADVAAELKDEGKTSLKELDVAFQRRGLPSELGLGLTGSQGLSLNALIGLTAVKEATHLPLASWGSGTRRIAALEITAVHQGERPIIVVDEIERGLEPYRQRTMLADIQRRGSQVFFTTHSAVAVEAASNATLWYVDPTGAIGCLAGTAAAHRLRAPEAYLARIAIVAEGATEVGFIEEVLRRQLGCDLQERGIFVSDGGGNDQTLTILEQLSASGLQFGGFADDEGTSPVRWERVKARMGDLLFRWKSGCIESNVIGMLDTAQFEAFIRPPDGASGERLRTLADRLGSEVKDLASLEGKTQDLRGLIIEASTGDVPGDREDLDHSEKKTWKRHAERWFKSVAGGRELAVKVFSLGLWDRIEPQLSPFIKAVRTAAGVESPAPPVSR